MDLRAAGRQPLPAATRTLSISSLRFHWVVPDRSVAAVRLDSPMQVMHLWTYTLETAAARAALLAVDAARPGHEVYYIAADDTTHPDPSLSLAARYYPDVPVRGPLEGHSSFFSTQKARRLLGWWHE